MQTTATLADDDCYLALKARDARFDGNFFTGVTSTGIYCRPVCSVKTPKRENCRFFRHAAQAETAGFRPCLRCRPELAPHSVVWSIQDASYILAHQAARLLEDDAPTLVASRTTLPPEGAGLAWGGPALRPSGCERQDPAITRLAARLGVSDRHVRRIFEAHFGVSPMQYLQTRRLHTAKQLIADTHLPMTQIALMSGFASVRRFNAAFLQHYRLNPTQLRRKALPAQRGERGQGGDPGRPASAGPAEKAGQAGDGSDSSAGITVRLGYRPPYDVSAMLAFFSKRAIDTMELIANNAHETCARRTFRIESGENTYCGWLDMRFDEKRSQLRLLVSDSLRDVLPLVIRRVRAMWDLDADPAAINSVLQASFPAGDGLRVPGTLDGFELAVRAVLGQQVTVAAARTLAQRLVDRFGETVQTPWPDVTRLFPTPALLASLADDDSGSSSALGQLGIVRQRQAAITGMARAVLERRLQLHDGAEVNSTLATLKALPGIGDWTAQYIAMRALRWPDAFPAGDVALHKALGVQGLKNPARLAEAASSAWKPWRSYAVIRVWSGTWQPANDGSAPPDAAIDAGSA